MDKKKTRKWRYYYIGYWDLLGRGPDTNHWYYTYENGEWLNDNPYVTIHRIASDGKIRGIFACAVDYCRNFCDDVRIDTHESNLVMQGLIEKNGFQRCGTIYVADGSPRIAYQWSRSI